jgi:hypothetical protein
MLYLAALARCASARQSFKNGISLILAWSRHKRNDWGEYLLAKDLPNWAREQVAFQRKLRRNEIGTNNPAEPRVQSAHALLDRAFDGSRRNRAIHVGIES